MMESEGIKNERKRERGGMIESGDERESEGEREGE